GEAGLLFLSVQSRETMTYVYLLESVSHPGNRYVGVTRDLNNRLKEHNAGKSPHTAKCKPWKIVVAIRFLDERRAEAFEEYLKSGSGHAFAKRHFW
ncbi:MAG: GIY-YIG nuclease family protein, partial [Planctomycetota bacterium]